MQKEYNSEEEFLKDYNPDEFEKLSMTTDIIIFSVSNKEQNNYRKLGEKSLSVLLVKRNDYPYKDMWCLPGGFLDVKNETLDEAASRILTSETNIHDIYIEQLYTFSDINRDPRMRVVSTSYMALIDKNRLKDKLSCNASWFDVSYTEDDNNIDVVLNNGNEIITFKIKKTLKELTTDRYKYTIVVNDKLAFDHPLVIVSGLSRLKNKLELRKNKSLKELEKIEDFISGIEDIEKRMIFTKRYIQFKRWDEIAKEMSMSESSVFRRHKEQLKRRENENKRKNI